MKDLFYSESEKLCFYVAGYTDSSFNVNETVKMLNTEAKKFATGIKVPKKEVRTNYITSSSRYKYMRVFFAKCKKAPKDAFLLDKKSGWTMDKWLKN